MATAVGGWVGAAAVGIAAAAGAREWLRGFGDGQVRGGAAEGAGLLVLCGAVAAVAYEALTA